MAAGDRCCALGVVRIVIGSVFPDRQIVLECHHGIEDREGHVEYGRLEEHVLDWKRAKSLVSASAWKVMLKFLAACEEEMMAKNKSSKGKLLHRFDEKKANTGNPPFSPI